MRAEAVADVLTQLVERDDALYEHLHLVVEAEGELREELHQRVVVGHLRDEGEMWARCGRDMGERQIWARGRRDVGEMQAGCGRDMGETWGDLGWATIEVCGTRPRVEASRRARFSRPA